MYKQTFQNPWGYVLKKNVEVWGLFKAYSFITELILASFRIDFYFM